MSYEQFNKMGGGDVIALVDPEKWDTAPQLAYANGWNDALEYWSKELAKYSTEEHLDALDRDFMEGK